MRLVLAVTVFFEMQFFGLTDPVILFHAAFELSEFGVDTCDIRHAEVGYLAKAENSEFMQRMFEDFADPDNLLQIVLFIEYG